MKAIAKGALRSVARRLPWGARMALFDGLCDRRLEPEILSLVARRIGVSGILASGTCGIIQSSADDRLILPAYARTGAWATRTVEFFQEFLGSDGTYLDIGANIGLTTIPIARNSRVRCFAFEPEPTNFSNLVKNVRRNICGTNVDLRRVALYSQVGNMMFGLASDGNLGDRRLLLDHRELGGQQTIEVLTVPLDSLELPITGRLGIKVDTQGAEPFVLAGGKQTFSRADICAIEFTPSQIRYLNGDPIVIVDCVRTFAQAAVSLGDTDSSLEFGPSDAVCNYLEDCVDRFSSDPGFFLDVYAIR